MSQSERERALRAAGDALAKYCDYLIEGAGAGGYPHMKERIDAWHAAALDTPQEPTPGPVCFQCAKPATLHFCSDEHARRGNSSPFASRKMETPYPMPCGLCDGQIDSEDDREWHGLGNCVPLCDRCMGSGIEPPAAAPEPTPAASPELARPRTLEELRREIGDIESELAVHVEHELDQREGRNADRETIAKLTTALAAAPRPALSPDALLVQKILEDAANLLDDYWLHDAKGNLIATKGNLRAAILGLKSKYLRAPAPREGSNS